MITVLDNVIYSGIKLNIYGAGKRARLIFDFLKEQGMTDIISCFIVRDTSVNPDEIEGIPVCSMDDERVNRDNNATVIALADRGETRKVEKNLQDAGYRDVWRIINWKFTDYMLYDAAKNYLEGMDYHIKVHKLVTDEFEFCHVIYKEDEKDIFSSEMFPYLPKFRFYYTMLSREVRVHEEFFPKDRLLEEFGKYYGKYVSLYRFTGKSDVSEMLGETCKQQFRIFRAVNAQDTAGLICSVPEYVTDIQAGAALTDLRVADITDDTGDNISNLNRDFSECTVLYWMWKNVHDADYVGLFHFARFIDIPGGDLQVIADADIDIVVTTPMIVGAPIREFFCPRYIPSKDWRLMEEALLRHYPEYAHTLDEYNRAFCYPGANLSIMRRDVFERYAEFIFSVMRDVADYYDSQGIVRNDRYAGYLCENLTAMFVMHHKDDYKIVYADLLYVKDLG